MKDYRGKSFLKWDGEGYPKGLPGHLRRVTRINRFKETETTKPMMPIMVLYRTWEHFALFVYFTIMYLFWCLEVLSYIHVWPRGRWVINGMLKAISENVCCCLYKTFISKSKWYNNTGLKNTVKTDSEPAIHVWGNIILKRGYLINSGSCPSTSSGGIGGNALAKSWYEIVGSLYIKFLI